MFYIRMADLNIAIDNKYSYVDFAEDTTVPEPRQIDLIASASDEEIKNEIGISEFPCSPAYAEESAFTEISAVSSQTIRCVSFPYRGHRV